MIWAKRGAAVVVAAGLIVGAVMIRNEVIEGDDADTPDTEEATTLVCLTELAALCNAVATGMDSVDVRVEAAATTSNAWSSTEQRPDEVWLTVAPLPDLVTAERARLRHVPLNLETDAIGVSQLVVAVPNGPKPDALTRTCGATLDWSCLGESAGQPWSNLNPEIPNEVRPALAPLTSAVGQLGVTQAVLGYFGDAPIDATDSGLINWARRLARAVSPNALSGGTPIATIQVRSSSLDAAVGFDAEIAEAQRSRLTVLYAAPMTRVDLVLAVPEGLAASDELAESLAAAAADHGWDTDTTAGLGEPLDADQVAQATRLWEELT